MSDASNSSSDSESSSSSSEQEEVGQTVARLESRVGSLIGSQAKLRNALAATHCEIFQLEKRAKEAEARLEAVLDLVHKKRERDAQAEIFRLGSKRAREAVLEALFNGHD